ncbi:hypothetical protein N7463_001558 [Penicillium fimorum]|uniref:Tetratricopeptide-like helical n=1 Tax=Penicillium fimorum TaxID=1882269 RepID=A0A9W9Y6C8_9EURO|nr:hypothetical protein N7463_001558 [Penicillium fimorum]
MDDIGAISTSCASCFDTLARSLCTSSDEFKRQMLPMAIENESARFKIWAGNLGALQRGRSSLDTRLRDSVVLRAAVLKFLGQLQDSLSKSAEITTGLRLPYEQSGDISQGPDENIEDSSDSSDSDSDMETAELAERLDEVKDIMEHLYRLSFKIRNTKHRSLTKKALLMKEEDPQTGKDLFSSYAIFDHRHVQELLDHLRLHPLSNEFAAEPTRDPKHGSFDVLDAEDHLLHSDDFLRDRLAKATTNRRRYFAYWRRHALKLSNVTNEQVLPQNFTTLMKPTQPVSKHPITPSISGNVELTPGPKTMLSGTDFSMYNRGLDDHLDTDTVISYATTAYDVDGNSSELPPPPADAAGKSEFVCPYCWVACPSRQGKGKSWQEHIRQDLQPYVCTYEKCTDADRMYASRHTWIEHERRVHRRVWRCFEHRSFISTSKNGLLQHFVDFHKDLDGQQIENIIDLAETTVADDRQMCPFCYSTGPFDKGLYNHMAYHQEQLATFAVSQNLDSNEEADSGKVEGIRSGGSLRSIDLYFPGGDNSLGSDDSEISVNKINNPLINAAGIGDEGVVRLLLENAAELNARGGKYGNALRAASSEGHERVVQMLLDNGAEVNAQGGEYGNALQAASSEGHERVVQMLLENGAEVNAQGGEYGSALQAASSEGHERVVQMLLENGAEVNARGGKYGNALQAALHGDHKWVAQMLLDRGAGIYTESGALDTEFTVDTVNQLALLYQDQGKPTEAEEIYQRGLVGREAALGPDHTSTLDTVNNFGTLLSNQGKLKEAEEMYRRALVGREIRQGLDHPSTLDTVNNLGNLFCKQGKLKEAEEMYRRALVGREAVLGLDHPPTFDTVNNLGTLFSKQGRLKEAEEIYQRALVGREALLGLDHPSALDTLNNLGDVFSDQGKLKEAEEIYQRALVGREIRLGLDHPSTLDTVNNLGNLFSDQGKLKEAEEMYRHALVGYEKALGLNHEKTRRILDQVNMLKMIDRK